jgi:hypothetical protein
VPADHRSVALAIRLRSKDPLWLLDALEPSLASIREGKARARDQIARRCRDQHLVGARLGCDTRRNVNCDSAHVPAGALDLAGVNASAD